MILETFPYAVGLCTYVIFILVRIFKVFIFKKKPYPIEKSIFILATFVYFSGLISVTIFPIPVDQKLIEDTISGGFYEKNNFIPFNSIINTFSTGFISTIITQIGGNLILLFPFGFLLPLIIENFKSLKRIIFLGFLTSLLIETLQFTLSLWIGFTYRSFDVDDLLLNTIGSVIGFLTFKLIYPILKKYAFS
ncbi:VanZ family protein [Bacillus sonorensis]|uniref:VanZ family protein n=1 Tax=Bacillus sonorensis TaxID=119858 RepID=UPI001F235289|nr:VanZ family protein [Bacillus sonorensis]MCF7619728.1 VanZ family protein [Bacillus sonorensis]MEC1503668.1 VanZ family protein [Bacillus sonorensis]